MHITDSDTNVRSPQSNLVSSSNIITAYSIDNIYNNIDLWFLEEMLSGMFLLKSKA